MDEKKLPAGEAAGRGEETTYRQDIVRSAARAIIKEAIRRDLTLYELECACAFAMAGIRKRAGQLKVAEIDLIL